MTESEKSSIHWRKTEVAPTRHAQTFAMIAAAATTTTRTKAFCVDVATDAEDAEKVVASRPDTAVLHITASPRQVKTQIARISYMPSGDAALQNHNSSNKMLKVANVVKPCTETPLTTPQTQGTQTTTQEEFIKKKDEREQEIQAIQNMLNEIKNSPKNEENEDLPTTKITHIPKDNINPSVTLTHRRSKSELLIDRPKAATARRDTKRTGTAKMRSRSSQPPPTISNELLPEKKKSYNVEEARRFMEEQKMKRRSTHYALPLFQANGEKSALEKEQIRKRLEELRKSSRAIVNKNIRKKRSSPYDVANTCTHIPTAEGSERDQRDAVGGASPNKAAKIESIFKPPPPRKKINRLSIQTARSTQNAESKLSLEIQKPENEVEAQKLTTKTTVEALLKATAFNSNPNPLMENQKRIGLLRKPETKDHSFSAIKDFSFDKENVALEMMTPQLTVPLEARIKDKLLITNPAAMPTKEEELKVKTITVEDVQPRPTSARLNTRDSVREKTTEMQDVPKLYSEMKETAKEDAEEPKVHEQLRERADLPYWLRPSTVQIYPYNFIMAVRRKLESITNPPPLPTQPATHITTNKKNQLTSTSDLRWKKCVDTPLSSVPKERVMEAQRNVKRRIVTNDLSESTEESLATYSRSPINRSKSATAGVAPAKSFNEQLHKSQTLSDLHSNFSSISIQLATSNTVSEMSSMKSEVVLVSKSKCRSAGADGSGAQRDYEDTTTVSSSIFNSPEKKPPKAEPNDDFEFVAPRPLSLKRVENLKISSKSKTRATVHSNRVDSKQADNDNSSNNTLQNEEQETTSNVGIDFNQLLDDFNRSLSQVIEVNEQLKSTLDKSHQIFSPRPSSATSVSQSKPAVQDGPQATDVEYTTDFEESSPHAIEQAVKQRVEKMHTSLHQRKRNLFEIANVVKPLLTSPKSEEVDSAAGGEKEEENVMNLDLENLTLSNGGKSSESSAQQIETIADSESGQISISKHEKRLQVIERLKENLKQSILNAKTNGDVGDKQQNVPSPASVITAQTSSLHSNRNDSRTSATVAHSSRSSSYTQHRQMSQSEVEASKEMESPQLQTSCSTALSDNPNSPAMQQATSMKNEHNATPSFVVNAQDSNSPASQKFSHSDSISEKLQIELGASSKDDESANRKLTTYTTTHREFSSNRAHDYFVTSHVNLSRGDFLMNFNDNAVANETQFQAAIKAADSIELTHDTGDADAAGSSGNLSAAPPSYNTVASAASATTQKFKLPTKCTKSTKQAIGSEIVAFFNKSDMETPKFSSRQNDGSLSESSLNYSSVGLYEKLIQTETTKSEHLTALLRLREKALIDRTKGQIAWLEMQKERYKAKGFMQQIAAIKKKQRGILMKMEKEREEIKRLLQSTTTTTTSTHSSEETQAAAPQTPSKHKKEHRSPQPRENTTPPALLLAPIPHKFHKTSSHRSAERNRQLQQVQKPQHIAATARSAPAAIVRANYELESSRSLEQLLQRREEDLQRRREHVERLMQWHQRLDQEEAEVLQLERMLLNYNNTHAPPATTTAVLTEHERSACSAATSRGSPQRRGAARATKMERRLKEIDRSLHELNSISACGSAVSGSNDESAAGATDSPAATDFVRTNGSKLNKLWRRLTSQQLEKFEPNRRYKLCKSDLEHLYEEAKCAVLQDFAEDEQRIAAELLEKSTATNISSCSNSKRSSNNNYLTAPQQAGQVAVPHLNLNFSSEQSGQEDMSAHNVLAAAAARPRQGNYSPSAAEVNFQLQTAARSSSSSCSETVSHHSNSLARGNVEKFLLLTQQLLGATNMRTELQRSHSDPQLADRTPAQIVFQSPSASSERELAVEQRESVSNSSTKLSELPSEMSLQGSTPEATVPSLETLLSVQSLKSLSSECCSPQPATEKAYIPSLQSGCTSASSQPNQSCSSAASYTPGNSGNPTATQDAAFVESQPTAMSCQSVASSAFSLKREHSVICSIGNAPSGTNNSIDTASKESTPLAIELSSATPTTEHSEDFQTASNTSQAKELATFSSQISNVSTSKAHEISAKLKSVTAAVSQLSQANALPTYASVQRKECAPADDIEMSTEVFLSSKATSSVEEALSDVASYSCLFEHISSDMYSPSGCTLKSAAAGSVENNESKTISPIVPQRRCEREQVATASVSANDLSASTSRTFTVNTSASVFQSVTFISEPNALNQSLAENRILDTYETDFESGSDETRLDDMSMPQFDSTIETTHEENADKDASEESNTSSAGQEPVEEAVEMARKSADSGTQSADAAVESKERQRPPSPPPPPPPITVTATASSSSASNGAQLMPDIINELEIRRCQQILLESEHLKQYEHVTATAVPYMYVREIPNKPPPPYVPPAHGSPMTTIFPSEERIKDITYRRTHELYCEILKTDYTNEKGEKLPSVLEEKITNIYERIILDICRDYLEEHQDVLAEGDPINFHSQLAFFNPPDRLRCIQKSIYKEVRRSLAMDKTSPKRTQVYSVYGQRAKRDHIGKIIIQEMYDEDDRWCNFHHEENEVLELIVEEMVANQLQPLAKEVLLAEGGTTDDDDDKVAAAEDGNESTKCSESAGAVLFAESKAIELSATAVGRNVEVLAVAAIPESVVKVTEVASS